MKCDNTNPEHAARSSRTPGAAGAHRRARRQKALETRWRIMDAAPAEFTERGYHDATMAAIAERAGVAVQTVYLGFRTKSGLLEEVVGNAVLGRGRDGEIGPRMRRRNSSGHWPSPTAPPRSRSGWRPHSPSISAPPRSATPADPRTRPIRTSPTGGCGARRCASTDACAWCERSRITGLSELI